MEITGVGITKQRIHRYIPIDSEIVFQSDPVTTGISIEIATPRCDAIGNIYGAVIRVARNDRVGKENLNHIIIHDTAVIPVKGAPGDFPVTTSSLRSAAIVIVGKCTLYQCRLIVQSGAECGIAGRLELTASQKRRTLPQINRSSIMVREFAA